MGMADFTNNNPNSTDSQDPMNLVFERPVIVVVDDHPDTLKLYEKVLSDSDSSYIVKTFTSPVEALEEIRKGETDLVLSDVMMPEMDGLELAATILLDKKLEGTSIVLITAAKFNTADKIRGLKTGAVDVMSKPVNFDEMLMKIKSFLRLRLLTKELAKSKAELLKMQRAVTEREKLNTLNSIIVTLNHEINNPLTTLIGNLELFLADPPAIKGIVEIQEAYTAALSIRDIVMKITRLRLGDKTMYLENIEMFDIRKV